MSRRSYTRNAFESELASGITAGATTIPLASTTGLVSPGYLTIAPDDDAKREIIKYANVNGNDLENCTRGLAGSTSGAQSHLATVPIRSTWAHQILDDVFDDVEDLEAFDTAHGGSTDGHPVATTSTDGLMDATDKTKLDGIETGAVKDHGNADGLADDDHTQYHNTARHAAVDHDALIDPSLIDHDVLAGLGDDDHTQYLLVDGSRAPTGDFEWPASVGPSVANFGGDGGKLYMTSTLVDTFDLYWSQGPDDGSRALLRLFGNNTDFLDVWIDGVLSINDKLEFGTLADHDAFGKLVLNEADNRLAVWIDTTEAFRFTAAGDIYQVGDSIIFNGLNSDDSIQMVQDARFIFRAAASEIGRIDTNLGFVLGDTEFRTDRVVIDGDMVLFRDSARTYLEHGPDAGGGNIILSGDGATTDAVFAIPNLPSDPGTTVALRYRISDGRLFAG
jgi:hypothetical protein